MTAAARTELRIRAILARVFSLAESDAARVQAQHDLPAWDSLGHMHLVAALEAEFGISFPAYAIAELVSVEGIRLAVEGLRAG
jgi:acyl carrier protein